MTNIENAAPAVKDVTEQVCPKCAKVTLSKSGMHGSCARKQRAEERANEVWTCRRCKVEQRGRFVPCDPSFLLCDKCETKRQTREAERARIAWLTPDRPLLEPYLGRRSAFTGTVDSIRGRRIVRNIRDEQGCLITDHMWFDRGFESVQLGARVRFTAVGAEYIKSRGRDYRLNQADNVEEVAS